MSLGKNKIRVVYSFPHKLGADRICYLAWQMVNSLAAAGADVFVFPGVLHRPVSNNVKVFPTLSWMKIRISYKIMGDMRACALHDYIVSRRVEKLAGKIDIIHVWPLGGLRTIRTAAKLRIPTVLERCNAHTKYAYDVVQRECERLGLTLPPDHEHAYKPDVLSKEEKEYGSADYILCPSDFVARTFIEKGFPKEKLVLYRYGFDEKKCYPGTKPQKGKPGLTMLFAGGCAPRKGLHYALEAWLRSPAHLKGTFLIVGDFVPGYAEKLSSMITHPSVKLLGYRKDLPDVMRQSDILVLPSIEEGSALVTWDGRGCGCVLLVSDATGAPCKHMENALVHRAGDVDTLAQHITMLHENRELLERLRENSLKTTHEMTWNDAGVRLLQVYKDIIAAKGNREGPLKCAE
jgi:glycosyltransferase involved in cell wall biosynthesis